MFNRNKENSGRSIDFWYGINCFALLVLLEVSLALISKHFFEHGQKSILITTFIARGLDVFLVIAFLKRKGLGAKAVGLDFISWQRGVAHAFAWCGILAFGLFLLTGTSLFRILNTFHLEMLHGRYLYLITGTIWGPAVEELVFRGWLYGAFRNRLNGVICIFLNAFVFAFAHGLEPRGLLLGFAGGIVFCLSYEVSRSLITPLILHVGGNVILHVFPEILNSVW